MKTFTLKTPGIPMWVTIFAMIAFVTGCALGLMAIFGQAWGQGFAQAFGQESMRAISTSWGSRTLGLGLIYGIAILLKSPNAYIVAFVGGLGRDLGDLLGELNESEPHISIMIGTAVFFIVGVLGIVAAYKARRLQTDHLLR